MVEVSATGFLASRSNLLRAGPQVALPQLSDPLLALAEHGLAGVAGFPEGAQA